MEYVTLPRNFLFTVPPFIVVNVLLYAFFHYPLSTVLPVIIYFINEVGLRLLGVKKRCLLSRLVLEYNSTLKGTKAFSETFIYT